MGSRQHHSSIRRVECYAPRGASERDWMFAGGRVRPGLPRALTGEGLSLADIDTLQISHLQKIQLRVNLSKILFCGQGFVRL